MPRTEKAQARLFQSVTNSPGDVVRQGRYQVALAALVTAVLLCTGCAGKQASNSMELVGGYTYVAPSDQHAELKGLVLLAMNDVTATEFPPIVLPQERLFAQAETPPKPGEDKVAPAAEQSKTSREEMLDMDADYVEDDLGGDYSDDETIRKTPSVPDPFEGFNRAMFQFNDFLYFYLLKPVSVGYLSVIPRPARIGVRNAFYNVRFPVRFANDILQGKITNAGREILRFLVDTIFGFGGLVRCSQGHDLLNPPPEDLGRTFAFWGIGPGPYFVWPILGPKTLRQTVGDIGDSFADPIMWMKPPWYTPYLIRVGERVNAVSLQIGEYEALKEAAIDPYTAIKDIYMQYRTRRYEENKSTPPAPAPAGAPGAAGETGP